MQAAGYKGFIRGKRGSTAENLSSLEYKIQQDNKCLQNIREQISEEQINCDRNHDAFMEIDGSGKKSITGKYFVSVKDYEKLTTLAKESYSVKSETERLREENERLQRQIWSLQTEIGKLKEALYKLTEKCKPYLEVLKFSPQKVKEFIDDILAKFKQQEKASFMSRKFSRKISLNSVAHALEIIKMKGRKTQWKTEFIMKRTVFGTKSRGIT